MRLPFRKGEADRRAMAEPEDQYLTPRKIDQLRRELERLISTDRPEAISEVRRLAEMGDFSENAGYQIAKGTLRRINDRILTLQEKLKTAVPIKLGSTDGSIRVGSTVVIESDGRQSTFEIVGSQETDPSRGRISHRSPLGVALLGRSVGDEVFVNQKIFRVVEVR